MGTLSWRRKWSEELRLQKQLERMGWEFAEWESRVMRRCRQP